jgi:hypothetical protein
MCAQWDSVDHGALLMKPCRRSQELLLAYGTDIFGVPMEVSSYGNCLFDSLALCVGQPAIGIQLRYRTAVELILHSDVYRKQNQWAAVSDSLYEGIYKLERYTFGDDCDLLHLAIVNNRKPTADKMLCCSISGHSTRRA